MFRLPEDPSAAWIPLGHAADDARSSGHVTPSSNAPLHVSAIRHPPRHRQEISVLTELQQLATTDTVRLLRQRINQRLAELGAGPQGPQTLLQLFESVCGWRTSQTVTQTATQKTGFSTSPNSETSELHSDITPVTTNGSNGGSFGSAPSMVASQTSDRPSATATALTSNMSRQMKHKQMGSSIQLSAAVSSIPSKGYYANLDTAPGLTLAKMLCASPEYALRESYFQKCFPMHRKQFEHATQPRSFLRTPRFRKVLISPDCIMIAMVGEKHWEVFKVGENFNYPPTLHCEGLMSGVYGRLTENRYPKKDRYAKEDEVTVEYPPPGPPDLGDFEWEFNHASLSNRYLAITGTKGMVRVFDLEKLGKPIYTYRSDFNAQAIALSPSGSLLVCSITGRDLKTDAVKPMIALHNLGDLRRKMRVRRDSAREGASRDPNTTPRRDSTVSTQRRDSGSTTQRRDSVATSTISRTSTTRTAESTHSNSSGSTFGMTRGSPTTLTTPYTDPVTRLIISAQETSILCATETQSRFFVIDVQSPVEPRLIMKSARRADPSPEAEGITDLSFFPNQQVVVVASLAKESPPIVVDTNVRNLHPALPPTSVSQPSLLSRLDSLGYNIHSVAVSPRGDAMAFVDKSGMVYVVYLDPHTYAARKTVLVAEVSSAQNAYEAAALRFSADGQVLFTVDYKGICHIQDWGAGMPNHAGVGKCQTLRANKS
ncbi:SPS-sensor component PTR3 [Yarrowia sp. E02]|nr:SPS-sensor component PTR3 [Yarrowia sp. E02]